MRLPEDLTLHELISATERLSGVGIWTYCRERQTLDWSDGAYRLLGYAPGAFEASLETVSQRVGAESRPAWVAGWKALIDEGVPLCQNFAMRGADDRVRCLRIRAEPRFGLHGRVSAAVAVVDDVTEAREQHAELERFRDLAVSAQEGIVITDMKGRIVWTNESFTLLTGFGKEEVIGRSPGELLQGPETDPETTAFIHERLKAQEAFTTEILNYTKFGDPYWIKLSITPRRDAQGKVIEYFGLEIDITKEREAQMELNQKRREMELHQFKLSRQKRELERISLDRERAVERLQAEIARRELLEQELRSLATTDELCQVPNRRRVMEQGRAEFQRARRYGHTLAVGQMDLDHFKRINDALGHDAGDVVLQAVSTIANRGVRQGIDLFGRTGGEEFVFLFPETSLEAAGAVAERIRTTIEAEPIIAGDRRVQVTTSIGLTELADGDERFEDMLRRADQALYEAKASGRNQVVARRWPEALPPAPEPEPAAGFQASGDLVAPPRPRS